ncbi:MAG: hypothetical protein AABX61_01340 [Nanoarchaeota archaeon]
MIIILPKDKKLETVFKRCEKKFVKVDKNNYIDYIKEAYSDLNSADKEDNEKWAITKAYQSLFLMCNALLVKNLGYYSKDHNCVIIALLKNKIISDKTIEKITKMLEEKQRLFSELKIKKDFFEEISNIRITRNKYLYLPKTQRKLSTSTKGIVEEVKEIIRLLGEEND